MPQIVSVQLLCYEELHISMVCSPSMLGNVPSGPLLKDAVSQPEQTRVNSARIKKCLHNFISQL